MYDGVLFLDGAGRRSSFTLGDVLEFRQGSEPLALLGLGADRHRASATG
jgi:hypothetical protein